MTEEHYRLDSKPRVLIVENDSDFRAYLKELIPLWGYEPIVVDGNGQQLIDSAELTARQHRCQIALLDMRLKYDFDPNDSSGLDLVETLFPTQSIILSGYGDHRVAIKSMEKKAASFVGKGDGPEAIKEELDKLARKLCHSFHEVKIGPLSTFEYILKNFSGEMPEEYQDQLGDLFVRLFPDAKNLKIEKLGSDESNTLSSTTAPRPRSVILKVHKDDHQPVIMKIARAHKIKKEAANFLGFIDGRIVGFRYPRLEKPESLWDIGGAVYSSLGARDVKTFPKFYIESNAEKVKHSLEQFFSETWSDLYRTTKKSVNTPLIELYWKTWGEEWYKERVVVFGEILGDDLPTTDHWKGYGACDPLLWLQNKLNDPDNYLTRAQENFVCVTHGDLHSGNLLVDQDNNSWVIDFERSGEGHILQDFVELETDIIIRLASHNQNIREFYKLCLVIVRPHEIRKFRAHEMSSSNAEYGKALQTISSIRSLARICTGVLDARQYLFGVLLNAIFRATLTKRDFRNTGQLRALMLASIVSHRLDHWDEPWPPVEWKTLLEEKNQ
jgi:ActR/RegA family two-component response regulator